jgi:predicted enzyme related to lactoylglutathione lyase
MKTHWAKWFEIAVNDIVRATQFYETIFNIKVQRLDLGNLKMGLFPQADVGCALCQGAAYKPSDTGTTVYFDAEPDLNFVLEKIETAGGKILLDKRLISPEQGYMALFQDSEGNRVALRSMG